MTAPDKRREQVLNALRAMSWGRVEMEGGYPAVVDGDTIPGYVLVADTGDNNGPELSVYRWPALFRWYADALRWRVNHPAEVLEGRDRGEEEEDALPGIVTAMHETMPDGIDLANLRGKTY